MSGVPLWPVFARGSRPHCLESLVANRELRSFHKIFHGSANFRDKLNSVSGKTTLVENQNIVPIKCRLLPSSSAQEAWKESHFLPVFLKDPFFACAAGWDGRRDGRRNGRGHGRGHGVLGCWAASTRDPMHR